MAYAVMWEFRVQPGKEKTFEYTYGPNGDWVSLFGKDAAFARTYLLRDSKEAGRYVTLDMWESETAYALFRAANKDKYAAIDARCEALTQEEREVGGFVMID